MSGLGTYLYGVMRARDRDSRLAWRGSRTTLRSQRSHCGELAALTSLVPRDEFESDRPGRPGLGRPQSTAA